ncbi:hypothetical protein BJV82DRAFT_625186 [Fennellomyces sp. T-0311]|nr:hypothetical protein BJV82DRAFT_625186 [Fennellomyces sp. T-0311]
MYIYAATVTMAKIYPFHWLCVPATSFFLWAVVLLSPSMQKRPRPARARKTKVFVFVHRFRRKGVRVAQTRVATLAPERQTPIKVHSHAVAIP